MSPQAKPADSRRARSESTKTSLMRAAEKLIADTGMENVSIRQIVTLAGQKNESALQYHFKNLSGLINAIHRARSRQIQAKRESLLNTLLAASPEPGLRDICMLFVQPAFELARADIHFRRYVKAFGHTLVMTQASPFDELSRQRDSDEGDQRFGQLLRAAVAHLKPNDYAHRMDAAVRLCSSSMYHQARQTNAFRGVQADLFLHSLVDALVGLLSAPVSPETKRLSGQVST